MIGLETVRRKDPPGDGSGALAGCGDLLGRLALWLADVSAEATLAARTPANHPAIGEGASDGKPARRAETP